ncbi:hypothetical protein LARV_01986 [Longilinea arvoryzae]|uniref:Nbr1 FW domain-containing protein n=1 Tax=Longilinea arvoryzae TaxID=360412 RepID=A0A0S7B9N1_9CHLR|nr:NBR1-Ig-like domain-containing protein [Longilinea arvoryzae]GAP14220.1 hypothetical protein LARV_01986 [Longilinea arvoryzae]
MASKSDLIRIGILLAALTIFVQGCNAIRPIRPAPNPDSTPFLAPTFVPTPIPPGVTVDPSTLRPTATPPCEDGLSFLTDLTIPDGSDVAAGATMDKRWEVQNSGTCNWTEDYSLHLIAGVDLGTQPEQALYPARSGMRAVIRMVFQAPIEPGSYRSAWQAYGPSGEAFGDPIFIDIVVSSAAVEETTQPAP